MKIKELIPAKGKWYLVVIDGEHTQPIMLRVVCFAHIEIKDRDGDLISSIQPLVHDPENPHACELVAGSDFGERVLGLQDPGMNQPGIWQSLFEEQIKAESDVEAKIDTERAAQNIKLTFNETKVLLSIKTCESIKGLDPIVAFDLATRGLIAAHQGGMEPSWYLTPLGQAVLHVNST